MQYRGIDTHNNVPTICIHQNFVNRNRNGDRVSAPKMFFCRYMYFKNGNEFLNTR